MKGIYCSNCGREGEVYDWGRLCKVCNTRREDDFNVKDRFKVTPDLEGKMVRITISNAVGEKLTVELPSVVARVLSYDLVKAANLVRSGKKEPDLSGVHDSDCTKYGCEGHRKPQVNISIDMDAVNRQLEDAVRGMKKLKWNERKQKEQERDGLRRNFGTVRVKPEAIQSFDIEAPGEGPFIATVDLGSAEAAAAESVLEQNTCVYCGSPSGDSDFCPKHVDRAPKAVKAAVGFFNHHAVVDQDAKCESCGELSGGTRLCNPCLFGGPKCAKCGKDKHDGWCWL